MLCWWRTLWWSSKNHCLCTANNLRADGKGSACVVVVVVRNMYGKASCDAGSVRTDEEDPSMTISPDLEAQILR